MYDQLVHKHNDAKSGDVGVLSKAAKIKTENFTSALKKDGRLSNSQKSLLPFVELCHLCD